MYIHLGSDILIKKNKIVAIIDFDTLKESKENKNFLTKMKKNKIKYISEKGKEKTLIITLHDCYISPISAATLFKRSGTNLHTVLQVMKKKAN